MAKKKKEKAEEFVDAGRLESEIIEPDEEVKEEFAEAARLNDATRKNLYDQLRENVPSETPILSGGDMDAAWDEAEDSGEETVGGSNPTPDQDVVEQLGQAVGLTYEDDEPLDTPGKIAERDKHRWELDPASAEDYKERE